MNATAHWEQVSVLEWKTFHKVGSKICSWASLKHLNSPLDPLRPINACHENACQCQTRRYFWPSDICDRRKWSHQIHWIELKGRPMTAKSFSFQVFFQMNKFVILHRRSFTCFCFRRFQLSNGVESYSEKKLLYNNDRQKGNYCG